MPTHRSRGKLVLAVAVTAARLAVAGVAAAADPITDELAAQHAILASRDPAIGVRGVVRFALEAAGNAWNPAAVEEALGLARSMQDVTPGSPHLGNFRWRLGDASVTDPNAVEFVIQLTSLLQLVHGDALSPRARDLVDAIHRDALVALEHHAVKPGYTNVFLMKTWNHLAVGQLHDDAEVEQRGRELWREWLAHIRRHGITEYSSPTYYGTDLDSLGLIARHARDTDLQREAEGALSFLWTGIAANWFAPARRLSGAHSRDYDYLFGRGYLDEHLHEAGWLSEPPPTESAGWLPRAPRDHLRVFRDACRWDPPAALHADTAARVPRFVVQRFNAEPWARSTNYVAKPFAIGVAGECRGPEDKSLAIHLPGGPATPNVAIVIDGRDDPYGRRKEPVGHGGQSKAHHLRTFLVSSQRGPRVTAAWMFDPRMPVFKANPDDLSCLRAHLIMPADAEVWTAEARLADGATLPGHATVFIRRQGVAVAIRSLLAADDGSAPSGFRLRTDAARIGAQRLTATLSDGPPTRRGIVALDIEAGDCADDAAFANFRATFSARPVTAVLAADRLRIDGSLALEADLASLQRISCEPLLTEGSLLTIDGDEAGSGLFPAR